MAGLRNSIEIKPLTPVIGAEMLGIDLCGQLSDDDIDMIREALNVHQVLFFRDQPLTPDQHLAFGRRFGELHVHPSTRALPRDQWQELLPIEVDENSGQNPGGRWHADVTCDEKPPYASILHLTTVPECGGDTMFSSMYKAYEALSEPMKKYLGQLTATHDGAPGYHHLQEKNQRQEKNQWQREKSVYPRTSHPIVATHPYSGRKMLYVNSVFTTHIDGVPKAESDAILNFLYEHVDRPEFQCRFRWETNSIAFWDNRACQHLAIWDYRPARRSGLRVTIRGDKPVQ